MPIYIRFNLYTNEKQEEIEVDSFSFGMVNGVTLDKQGSGAGTGKVTFHEMNITKKLDSSSPQLMIYCDNGNLLPAVQMVFNQANGGTYLTYNLKDVLISAIDWGSGGDVPTESLSLAFEEFEFIYTNPNGENSTETIRTEGQFFYPTS